MNASTASARSSTGSTGNESIGMTNSIDRSPLPRTDRLCISAEVSVKPHRCIFSYRCAAALASETVDSADIALTTLALEMWHWQWKWQWQWHYHWFVWREVGWFGAGLALARPELQHQYRRWDSRAGMRWWRPSGSLQLPAEPPTSVPPATPAADNDSDSQCAPWRGLSINWSIIISMTTQGTDDEREAMSSSTSTCLIIIIIIIIIIINIII